MFKRMAIAGPLFGIGIIVGIIGIFTHVSVLVIGGLLAIAGISIVGYTMYQVFSGASSLLGAARREAEARREKVLPPDAGRIQREFRGRF